MALKSLLGKYGRKGWPHKEDNRALDATGAGDHLKEFSAVRAVVTNAPSVGMDVLRLPRVGCKLHPLTLERFTNPAPWNLCHDYPLGKVPAHPTGLFGAYQNYFAPPAEGEGAGEVEGIRAEPPPVCALFPMRKRGHEGVRYGATVHDTRRERSVLTYSSTVVWAGFTPTYTTPERG